MTRRTELSARRDCLRQKFALGPDKVKLYVEVGLYPDGRPGELFLTLDKTGSTERAWIDTVARMVSYLLQYGAPLDAVIDMLLNTQFAPRGLVQGDPRIRLVTSPLDLVGRWLAIEFAGRTDLIQGTPPQPASTGGA